MQKITRLLSSAAALMLAAGAMLVPATAQAAPILAETDSAAACEVTGGDLNWGVRESFRSYITGIAAGAWEVADGATYETPLFGWSNPTGEIDASTGVGAVSFKGSVHFTGHDGTLNLKLSNPTIEFTDDGTARLLLDSMSQRISGEIAIDEQQVYFGKIEGYDAIDPSSGTVSLADASVVLTADGALAFGEFYASGEALDPITLNLQLAPCPGAVAPTGNEDQGAVDEAAVTAEAQSNAGTSQVPWLPIALGGVALVIIAVTVGLLIAGRKKTPVAAQDDASSVEEQTAGH